MLVIADLPAVAIRRFAPALLDAGRLRQEGLQQQRQFVPQVGPKLRHRWRLVE
jgi:hypothetical protein